ncbi:MAG: methyltransferase domain-containing protein [bacterium]
MFELTVFNRYRTIIKDWSGFLEAVSQPLPTCIWGNPLRVSASALGERLHGSGLAFEPVSWYPGAFRLPWESRMGSRVEYLAGLCHIQEEIALAPALLLAPKPGERVLDLCAAPGNKTAQIALMMNGRGTVVANDYDLNRMRPLRRVVERLGLVNVTTTLCDAANYPKEAGEFDRVLADVPCSCEGTSRKNPELFAKTSEVGRLRGLQTAILRKALQLCKPGGRVVYATCTYAPEENEMVVQEALDSVAAKIPARILAVTLPGLIWSPGLSCWQGQRFRADMPNALRIYPHQNDTGGFFIAVMEKGQSSPASGNLTPISAGGPTKPSLARVDSEPWFEYLHAYFGLAPQVFHDYFLFKANGKSVSIANKDLAPTVRPLVHTAGISFVKTNMKYPKLSTAAAMKFGHAASQNVVEVSEQQAADYLSGRSFAVENEQGCFAHEKGYVIVRREGVPLGVGMLVETNAAAVVHSLFPKAWRVKFEAL